MSEDKQHYIIEDICMRTKGIYVETMWHRLPAYERKKDITNPPKKFQVGSIFFRSIPILIKVEIEKSKRYTIKKISKKEAFIHLL